MSSSEKILRRAEKWVVSNRLDKAAEAYEEYLQSSPEDVSILNVLGDILIRLNRQADASKCFDQAASLYLTQGKLTNAMAMYRRLLELNPQLFDIALKMASLSFKTQDFTELARLLQHLLRQLQTREALQESDQQTIQRALKFAEEALKAAPQHAALLAAAAGLSRLANKTEQAYDLDMRLGEALLQAGRYEESLQTLCPLMSFGTDSPRLLEAIANAHLKKGDPQTAITLLVEAVERNPNSIELLRAKAQILILSGKHREAIESYHKLLLRQPTAFKEILSLAENLLDAGHLDDSLAALELLTPELTVNNKSHIMSLCKKALARDLNHVPWLEKMAFIQMEMNQILALAATYSSLFRLHLNQGNQIRAFQVGQYLQQTGYTDELFKNQFAQLSATLHADPAMASLLKRQARLHPELPGKMRLAPQIADLASKTQMLDHTSPDSLRGELSESESVLLNADLLVKYGAREKALDYLKSQIQKDPTKIPIQDKLKQYLVEWRRLPEAAQQCLALANLYRSAGELSKAQELLKEARGYDPTLPGIGAPAVPTIQQAISPAAVPTVLPVRDLASLQPGEIISHFKILSKLGGGGMGVVYRAHDLHLEREVALKVLSPQAVEMDRHRERFLQEARSASRLNHKNICVIYGIESLEDTNIIIMEYIEGRNLLEMIVEGPLSIKKTINYGMQLADALEEAHSQNIIHRDIKSSNILVTDRHEIVKVLDFGLAKQVVPNLADAVRLSEEVLGQQVTQEGTIVGTVTYMSPEQALGEPLDPRSDIFSMGVVLYEIVTTRLPFEGRHYFEILYGIVNTDPDLPQSINPAVTPELARIIMKALEKDPNDRYFSARQIHSDLEKLASWTD